MDDGWDDALALLHAGVLSSADAHALFASLRALLEIDAAVVTGEWAGFGSEYSYGIPAGWPVAYAEWSHQDPSPVVLASRPPGSWFFLNGELGPGRDTELYRAFRGQGLHDGAIAQFEIRSGRMYVVFYRAQGEHGRDFDRGDRLRLNLLAPHLSRGFGRHASIAAWQGFRATERDLALAELPHVVLGCADRSVRISPHAEAMLEAVSARSSPARLEAVLWHAARHVSARSLLGGICSEAFPRREPDGRVVEVLLLLSLDSAPSMRPDAMTPAEELLSPRQRLVARFIAFGRTIHETAAALDSKPETVRRHLKLVYERLGVSDRPSLTRLVHL